MNRGEGSGSGKFDDDGRKSFRNGNETYQQLEGSQPD